MTDVISQISSSDHEAKLLKLHEVMYRCGLSRAQIYLMMKKGEFPKQIRIATRSVAWNSQAIEDWIMKKINEAS